MRVLGALGLDPQARTEVLALLNNYLFGFAHRETARDQLIKRAGLTEPQWQQRLRRYAAHTRHRDPELARDIETRMHLTSNDSFEFGLDCLLSGITMRLELRRQVAAALTDAGTSVMPVTATVLFHGTVDLTALSHFRW